MKISVDTYGNHILKITSSDFNEGRGFSVQTNGNLPHTHQHGIGKETIIELKVYLAKYGTERQKQKVGTLITRKEYMSCSSFAHHAYYLQFAHKDGSTHEWVKNVIGLNSLLKSEDKYFNDIKLPYNNMNRGGGGGGGWTWDATPFDVALLRAAGETSVNSPSCHTSVGKAVALDLVENHKKV